MISDLTPSSRSIFHDSDDLETTTTTTTTTTATTTATSCSSYSIKEMNLISDQLLLQSPENLSLLLKPHRSSDSTFEAIVSSTNANNRPLSFNDFKLIRRIGSGDISTVYLCRLRSDDEAEYAMKVVDKLALASKNKTQRAEVEKKILQVLDHPFLPTLYCHFNASHFSCIVMEYCSAGDLHSLRHKLPSHRFPLASARFYAAEVLVAMEYLHMLGIIYRDLKPENVLVRSDGHIMLSDFDLSLCSDSIPAVHSPNISSPSHPTTVQTTPTPPLPSSPTIRNHNHHNMNNTPLFSCIPYKRLFRSKKIQTLTNNRLFVAEPVTARSCSFVGTHEYISPEVASGNSHGNAVDWWAFGIFIYEMIYGRTPFVGTSNSVTLRNILKKPLTFPTPAPSSKLEAHARDLISGLLIKDPVYRLGSSRGAADVKTHPFFKGLNFALIRSVTPPKVAVMPPRPDLPVKEVGKDSTSFDYF